MESSSTIKKGIFIQAKFPWRVKVERSLIPNIFMIN